MDTDGTPPAPGLRERKRAAAMDRIQHVAVELFDSRGFHRVTVEEVAAAAEVSPSTVYRYFGTKEGLVLHDKWDDRVLAVARHLLLTEDISDAAAEALRLTLDEHFEAELEMTVRRWDYLLREPAIAQRALVDVQGWADQLADVMLSTGRYGSRLTDVRPLAAALVWGVYEAVRAWFEEGQEGSIAELLLATVARLRPAPEKA